MRRFVIAVTACAVLLSAAAVAQAAPRVHVGDGHHVPGGPAACAAGLPDGGPLATAAAVPGTRQASGSATLAGWVRDSSGSAVPNAEILWELIDNAGRSQAFGSGTANSSGWYSVDATPTPEGKKYGMVYTFYNSGATTLGFQNQVWSPFTTTQFDFDPGYVTAGAALGGPWAKDFSYVSFRLWGPGRYSYGRVWADGTKKPRGDFDANAGLYTSGCANFFHNEGIEFRKDISVLTGWGAEGPSVNQAKAQRIWVSSPAWASGKPGSAIKVTRNQFPKGWVNQVAGYTDAPGRPGSKAFGKKTSSGAKKQTLGLTVPKKAKPGYSYWIRLQHANGMKTLSLETSFQVCTLKASKTKVKRGAKIRVTGIVPVEGHWGNTRGKPTTVTLYAHKGAAKAPTKWDPKSQGWIKVGSVRTNGLGVYTTPYFKPLKTLTLVVRYPGDDWYRRAYTSTSRITVK